MPVFLQHLRPIAHPNALTADACILAKTRTQPNALELAIKSRHACTHIHCTRAQTFDGHDPTCHAHAPWYSTRTRTQTYTPSIGMPQTDLKSMRFPGSTRVFSSKNVISITGSLAVGLRGACLEQSERMARSGIEVGRGGVQDK